MYIKLLLIALLLGSAVNDLRSQCGNCNQRPSIVQYDLDVQVPAPQLKGEETKGWLEWKQLFWLNRYAQSYLFQHNKNCIRFLHPSSFSNESTISKEGVEIPALTNENSDIVKIGDTYTNLPPSGPLAGNGTYITTGFVKAAGEGFIMHLEIQTSCTRKTVAFAEVPFVVSSSSDYMTSIANNAAAQLTPLIDKIKQFELAERDGSKTIALDAWQDEAININPKKKNLSAGEQTEIELTLRDCDGKLLGNREIVFGDGMIGGVPVRGTIGGVVTPSRVVTNANGTAKAIFKMGSGKTAVINAHHVYDKPTGCSFVKAGSFPIGGVPIKVVIDLDHEEEINYFLELATLPGIKKTGGNEKRITEMFHRSIFYYYPSAQQVQNGELISTNAGPRSNGKTERVIETGFFSFEEKLETAKYVTMVGNVEVVNAVENGKSTTNVGFASLNYPSNVAFHRGDASTPPYFSWDIDYPASNEGRASYAMAFSKCDSAIQWTVKPVSDPNSPYKTEYLLKIDIDLAKENAEGAKNIKDWLKLDINGLAKVSGYTRFTVKIYSPFTDPAYRCR